MDKKKEDGLVGCLAFLQVVPVVLAIFACLVLLGATVFWAIWNWLVPDLFGWPTITFWQSVGINFMLQIVGGYFKSSTSSKS